MKRIRIVISCIALLLMLSSCSDQGSFEDATTALPWEAEATASTEESAKHNENSKGSVSSTSMESSKGIESSTSTENSGGIESNASEVVNASTDSSSSPGEEHTEFDPYYEETSEEYPFHQEGYPAPEDWPERYPHGSAGRLEGTIAVVSIFADDQFGTWDATDQKNRARNSRAYYDLRLACDFLTTESAKYDKTVSFLWDWMEHSELYYEADLKAVNLANVLYDYGTIDQMIWTFIEQNVDSEGIRKRYQADSVIYMVYANSPADMNGPSCTRNFYLGMEYPYEICYIQMNQNDRETPPSVFAHEMLHTFGAPDIYWTDIYTNYRLEYGITKDYVKQINKNGLNDIMRITWDPKTGNYLYHSIAQEITDITAYYVGLTDESETVKKWGFEPSQHAQQ